jgi:hypothetical protein
VSLQSGNCQNRAVVPAFKDRKSGRGLEFLSCPINQAKTKQRQETIVEVRNKRFDAGFHCDEGVARSDRDVLEIEFFHGCAATDH